MTDDTTETFNTGNNVVPLHPPDPDAIDAAGPPIPAQTRRLLCKLKSADIADIARDMSTLENEIDARRSDMRESNRVERKELKVLEQRARDMRQGVLEGEMWRDVEVRDEVHDLSMATIRVDTGQCIDKRPLTDLERQVAMDLATAQSAEETGVGRKAKKPRKPKAEPATETAPDDEG